MSTTAGEFLARCEAGLVLCMVNGKAEWMGTQEQFELAERLITQYD